MEHIVWNENQTYTFDYVIREHISSIQKVSESEILDFAKAQLTLPDKFDPSDAMNWQHTLYSRLGGGRTPREEDEDKKLVPTVDDTVDRIVA